MSVEFRAQSSSQLLVEEFWEDWELSALIHMRAEPFPPWPWCFPPLSQGRGCAGLPQGLSQFYVHG